MRMVIEAFGQTVLAVLFGKKIIMVFIEILEVVTSF